MAPDRAIVELEAVHKFISEQCDQSKRSLDLCDTYHGRQAIGMEIAAFDKCLRVVEARLDKLRET